MSEWDVDAFTDLIINCTSEDLHRAPNANFMKWLGSKGLDWHQQFYALLEREAEAKSKLYRLKRCKIIRLVDGEYAAGPSCHFFDERGSKAKGVRCVDQGVYAAGKSKAQQEAAHKFLESVGVTAVGERRLIEALLKSIYIDGERTLNEREYLAHMRRFIKLLDEDASIKPLLSSSLLFMGSDNRWRRASEIYLDTPYHETGLTEYFEVVRTPSQPVPLAAFYQTLAIDQPKLARFAEKLGAHTKMPVARTSCGKNPRWDYLRSALGERYTSPIDRDFSFDRFNLLAAQKSERLARLTWDTMRELPDSNFGYDSANLQNPLRAVYRKNERGGANFAESQLVHQLRAEAWVPQRGNGFVRPASARQELLPEGFTFDAGWPWIKAIQFGQSIHLENEKAQAEASAASERQRAETAAAKSLGFQDAETARQMAKIPVDEARRMYAEWERRQNVELPEHIPGNPARRVDHIVAQAADAPERRTEKRQRSVSVNREGVKIETDEYLRQQYTNRDSEQICQICMYILPFKLGDGTYFFEAVELIPELKRHHSRNYLCLCPNHSAMFRHANQSRETLRKRISLQTENQLSVTLANQDETIYFTKTHLADLKAIIKADVMTEASDKPSQSAASE
jgi:hypothetical protein